MITCLPAHTTTAPDRGSQKKKQTCCRIWITVGQTYAEMKEEEADAINAWILNHNYQVISEKDFYNQDTITNENQFVLFEESGVK